jgi:RecB family exonuclease
MAKKTISYSQFALWCQCPYSWKLQYVDKALPFTDNIHTLFGTSMHEVLQEYIKVMYTDSIKEADKLILHEELEDRLKKNFMEIKMRNGGEEFCTKDEMTEFYNDGLRILEFFKRKRGDYFSKKGYELLGIETALNYDLPNNLKFKGFIDLIIKDNIRNRIKIIDIKTSSWGWNKYTKADKNKTDQLLLYKSFYAKQFDIPLDRIDVEYFIVKRKLYENTDFPQKRVQKFVPANGKPSINKVIKRLQHFMEECYDKEGNIIAHDYEKCHPKSKCKSFTKCKDL